MTENPAGWNRHTRPERPRYSSWAPTEGQPAYPILSALRDAGFLAQIGSRKEPPNNFEVRYLADEAEQVEKIIRGIDPEAYELSTGR